MRPAARMVVVGSCNLDQAVTVTAAPGPGTTVTAGSWREEPGGKGLNQALAAARAGADVRMIGAVGDDDAGRAVRRVLGTAGVDTSLLRRAGTGTGRAVVVVDAERENRIVVVPGANAGVESLSGADRDAVAGAALLVLVLQLELPRAAVLDAARTAAAAGVPVALTPAPVDDPAGGDLDELFGHTSVLFVNEHEMAMITGRRDAGAGLPRLLRRVPAAVVTSGARGSDYADRSGARHHRDAVPVVPVDTTAAGDTYAGVFLAARLRGAAVPVAMERATAAASVVVGRRGTSGAIPTAAEIALSVTGRRHPPPSLAGTRPPE